MVLKINGREITVPDHIETVAALLEHLSLVNKIVVVEQNSIILEKTSHLDALLSHGDQIEIVTFVGGG